MNYYFLGIGGIGMSAIARYYNARGQKVAGYDRTPSKLTRELESEGIAIHYQDAIENIPSIYQDKANTLVVYTPAIPLDNKERIFFEAHAFTLKKRAAVLGDITRVERGLCIAGTHGKTSTSIMTAHLLKQSHVDCNAFLGGIAVDYNSNLMLSNTSDLVVIEADEFDRSFHHLSPYMAVVTSVDPDHLDIYGTHEAYLESFAHFTSLIQAGGCLLSKAGLALQPRLQQGVTHYFYSGLWTPESNLAKPDFYATNLVINNGTINFDFVTPTQTIANIELGVPMLINVENGVAAMAIAYLNGVTPEELRTNMQNYKGVRRRFEYHLKSEKLHVIDDYAHHPTELKASIESLKAIYQDKRIQIVFQPHLYSRTNDFYKEFAQALSLIDDVLVVEIYPAREKPIPGVNSQLIVDACTSAHKGVCTKEEVASLLKDKTFDVLVTLGAGDINTYIPSIIQTITH